MEHNMEFQLANGKLLHIKGSRFMVEVLDDQIIIDIQPSQKANIKPFEQEFDRILNDTPAYIKKEEQTKVIKLSEIEKSTSDHDQITEIGKTVFNKFMKTWSQGFGDENAEQPDRATLMNKTMSDYSLHVIRYVKSVGGLTSATMRAFPTTDYTYIPYRKQMRLLAENIAQVSSILCPPLSELLEYPFLIEQP